MERNVFICDCHSLEHQVSFWYDEEDRLLYIEPHLVTYRNFFKRFIVGLKYTFGYKSRFGEFDSILLSPKSQKKLFNILNEICSI